MKKIIEIKEDVQIGDVILEKGDKVQVLEEAFLSKASLADVKNLEDLPSNLSKFLYREIDKFVWYNDTTIAGIVGKGTVIRLNGKLSGGKLVVDDYEADTQKSFVRSYGLKDFERI